LVDIAHAKLNCSGDVQSIDAARAWNNEYSLEGKNPKIRKIFKMKFHEISNIF